MSLLVPSLRACKIRLLVRNKKTSRREVFLLVDTTALAIEYTEAT